MCFYCFYYVTPDTFNTYLGFHKENIEMDKLVLKIR